MHWILLGRCNSTLPERLSTCLENIPPGCSPEISGCRAYGSLDSAYPKSTIVWYPLEVSISRSLIGFPRKLSTNETIIKAMPGMFAKFLFAGNRAGIHKSNRPPTNILQVFCMLLGEITCVPTPQASCWDYLDVLQEVQCRPGQALVLVLGS